MAKNIILQHWEGELGELEQKSIKSIGDYASYFDADHEVVLGRPFSDSLPMYSPLQKMIMLDEKYDEYDLVVMTDPDMFVRGNLEERMNIFTEEDGVGGHTHIQDGLQEGLVRKFPMLLDITCSYWGGSTYRLSRSIRQKLRKYISPRDINIFKDRTNHADEGMMFRLASQAGIKGHYFKDARWQWPSHWEGVETQSQFIHIRKKPKSKIENYRDLVSKGVIIE